MILILVFASAAAIFINLVAFAANAGVLWVVLRNKTLKKDPTSVFLVNLCAADLAVAVVVIPVATVILILWSFDGLCGSLSFFHSLLVNAGAWAAAAISVDRRFSIVSPMAHAAFMTSRRALMGVALVWITAVLFAIVPHLYSNDSSNYLFNYKKSTTSATTMIISIVSSTSAIAGNSPHTMLSHLPPALTSANSSSAIYFLSSHNSSVSTLRTKGIQCRLWKTCALMFTLDWSNSSQVFSMLIGCYLIPTCIMVTMYLSIFKVARKAEIRVCPSGQSGISTISEEVEIKEESERNASHGGRKEEGENMADKENEEKGSQMFGDTLTKETLDRIGIQIGNGKHSRPVGRPEFEPESTRHCIFQHLFPEEESQTPGVEDEQFHDGVLEISSEKFPGTSRAAGKRCSCSTNQRCSECGPSVVRSAACTTAAAGGKARRTLLLILGLSLASWSPYYLLHAYCACTDDCWVPITSCPPWGRVGLERGMPHDGPSGSRHLSTCEIPCTSDTFPVSFLIYQRSLAALVVAWLLFLSSAFNPILYGLLNRPVREQIVLRAASTAAFCSSIFRCMCRGGDRGISGGGNPRHEGEDADGGEEDFLQFLERTSSLSEAAARLPTLVVRATTSQHSASAAEVVR